MKHYLSKTILLMLLFSTSICIARDVLVPSNDFLVIVGDNDSVYTFYDKFSKKGISLTDYVRLIDRINPEFEITQIEHDEPLSKDTIFQLPGAITLSEYTKEKGLSDERLADGDDIPEIVTQDKAGSYEYSYMDNTPNHNGVVKKRSPETGELWFVNLGSYSGADIAMKALQQFQQFQQMDEKLSIQVDDVKGQTFYRVRSTSFISRSDAESAAKRYESTLKIKGLWVGKLPNKASNSKAISNVNLLDKDSVSKDIGNEYFKPSFKSETRSIPLYEEDKNYSLDFSDDSLRDKSVNSSIFETEVYSAEPHSLANHDIHQHIALDGQQAIKLCLTENAHRELAVQLRNVFDSAFLNNFSKTNIEKIEYFLADLGYLDAEIVGNKNTIFYINPHSLYMVTKVIVEPSTLISEEQETHVRTQLVVNEIYSKKLERIAKKLAIDWLAENGFPQINYLESYHRRNSINSTVEIVFSYEPSPRINIFQYEQYGERNFRKDHLEVLSPFSESPQFSLSTLEEFRNRLMSSGYYTDVQFDLITDESENFKNPILGISTQSKEVSNFEGNLGFSSGRDTIFNAKAVFQNLTLQEDDLTLDIAFDSLSQTLSADYTQHNIYQYGLDFGAYAKIVDEDNGYFQGDTKSIKFFINRHANELNNDAFFSYGASLIRSNETIKKQGSLTKGYNYWRLTAGRSGWLGIGEKNNFWSIEANYNIGNTRTNMDFWSLNTSFLWKQALSKSTSVMWRSSIESIYAKN